MQNKMMSCLLAAFVALVASGASTPAHAQSEESLRTQRHEALRTILAGKPMQAANDLLAVLRELPTDNPLWADLALGNLQLLQFDINYLMDARTRQEFFNKSLDAENNEMDAFLKTLHLATLRKTESEYDAFLKRLDEHSRGPNEMVAVLALYYLANPYFTANTPVGAEASERMATRYTTLKTTRNMVELPIYHWRNRCDVASEWIRAYLALPVAPGHVRIREVTEAEQRVARFLPFVRNLQPILSAFEQSSVKRDGVDGLCALIADETGDWRDRYGYLRMLEPEMKPPPGGAGTQGYWRYIRPPLEALANREELTPDVYRARVLLCRVACEAQEFEYARYWAERVLTEQERLIEHPERILYEEAVDTYQGYADAMVAQRQYEQAARAYERLGAFYPNSAVATDCRKLATGTRQRTM